MRFHHELRTVRISSSQLPDAAETPEKFLILCSLNNEKSPGRDRPRLKVSSVFAESDRASSLPSSSPLAPLCSFDARPEGERKDARSMVAILTRVDAERQPFRVIVSNQANGLTVDQERVAKRQPVAE